MLRHEVHSTLKRVIIGPSEEMNGKYVMAVNPDLIYLDTCIWIDMFRAYRNNQERLIENIATAIGNDKFRLLVSTINFFELIGTSGDISEHFAPESFRALDYVRQTSVHQPPVITEQEVVRFVNRTSQEVRILDQDNFPIRRIAEGFEQRKKGNAAWFHEIRQWWNESNERDRVLNLDADLYELSHVIAYNSLSEMVRTRNDVLNGPLNQVKAKRMELGKKKATFKGKKKIPVEGKEIVLNIRHRIDRALCEKYGEAEVSMVVSNLGIVFPRSTEIARDIIRSSRLTLAEARKEMPGLYWQAKVDYYNRYYGQQKASGQLGDRNHAVYIPYCNYFGTSDSRLIKALESEFQSVLVKDKLRIFRTA
jgi:hypothetical protein